MEVPRFPGARAPGGCETLFDVLETDDPAGAARCLADADAAVPLAEVPLLARIDPQGVWPVGVT